MKYMKANAFDIDVDCKNRPQLNMNIECANCVKKGCRIIHMIKQMSAKKCLWLHARV